MDNWRKKGDKCNQPVGRTKFNNHYRKPPLDGNSNWQPNLPLWEKRFVTKVGSISWKKFLEAKEFTHLYDNILKWDDSAGEEAFRNAKDEFYAKIHGLLCDFRPPNPDLYVDEIDWNSEVDQDLLPDLESDSVAHDGNSEHEPVVIFGDVIPNPYQYYSPYGWGDSDDKMNKPANDASAANDGVNWDDYVNKWDDWDVGAGNHWWGWNENDDKEGDRGWSNDKNVYCGWNNDYGNVNYERREGYVNKTSRYHGDNNRRNRSWRNNGNGNGNGNRRKSTAQGHGNQRVHVSTIQGHGNQHIHVHP